MVLQFIELTVAKRQLEAQLRDVQSGLTHYERLILDAWEPEGISQIRANGYLVYKSSRVWPIVEDLDREAVGDEFPTLLTVNSQKAGSLLTEYLAAGDKEGLAQLARAGIRPNEITKLHVKKG